MWRDLALALAAAVLCTAGLACDSEESSLPAGGGNGDVDRLVRAICTTYRDCCRKAGHGIEPLAACESVFKQEASAFHFVEQGTSAFDPIALERCLAALERATQKCSFTEVNSACNGLFVGTRDEGAPCENVAECRSSTPVVCVVPQLADGGRGSGTCRQAPRAQLGAPCHSTCESDEDCRSTSFTSVPDRPLGLCHEADGLYCESSSCARHVALGGSCTYDMQCGPTGSCSEESGPAGTCLALVPAGAACERSTQCERPLACLAGRCAERVVATEKLCVEGDFD
jgi:hypothetical protein